MSIQLPPAIDLYVKAENSGDIQAMSECFAPNAIVRDESRTYKGLAAIKEWKAQTKKKYNHSVAPLEVAQRDGRTLLKARLTGNFPGSPVTLEFSFVLEGGKIASLEIH
jgi:SnoaL-like domain